MKIRLKNQTKEDEVTNNLNKNPLELSVVCYLLLTESPLTLCNQNNVGCDGGGIAPRMQLECDIVAFQRLSPKTGSLPRLNSARTPHKHAHSTQDLI